MSCDAGARPMHPMCMFSGILAWYGSDMYVMSAALVQPMVATVSEKPICTSSGGGRELQVQISSLDEYLLRGVRLRHVRDVGRLGPAHGGDGVGEAHVIMGHAGAGVGNVVALHTLGIRDRRPLELVAQGGVVHAVFLQELVDGHDLVVSVVAREVARGEGRAVDLVRPRLETPPRCCVGAKGLALRVLARRQVEHLDRQNVTRLGALDVDRAGQHVHAIAAAGGAAARDGL
eukprot:CAMPEP_0185345826 /NCGR_PEP_ID=MMETSP1363-20130426/100817_1 /TAXON_ID=38817 /ORGANISM="Gephyrocapsa oceanica, Strain RCC1303" /LENGTH=231 /DNA_ID=CAMNT_0027945053 /DNA_START=389 /DNA_END=1081 /DNA_ORIENTATION=-